jgi:hypothetical protein
MNFFTACKEVFLDQSEHLFFHFFGKVTKGEPVCRQMIVIAAALSVFKIEKLKVNKQMCWN